MVLSGAKRWCSGAKRWWLAGWGAWQSGCTWALLLVSLVVQSFFLLGGRKGVHMEMFVMVSGDLVWALF